MNRHIVIVNSSMVCGGAERVIAILAKNWVSTGTRVTVVTIHAEDSDHHRLDSRVARRSLDANKESRTLMQGLLNNHQRIRKMRSVFKSLKPTVIISFQDKNNVLALIAAAGMAVPVVVSERNDPRMRSLSPMWDRLRRITYRSASALVVQTHSLREWAGSKVDCERVYVLPNPVIAAPVNLGSKKHRSCKIVAAGRLVEQKGFDILLEAIADCDGQWPLEIIGDGPERENLELRAKELGIDSRVRFVGKVEDPSIIFKDADLFVLSSRYEGFPNVLLEAMACGLPAVSFDCASGPSEIIREGIDGLLVPPGDTLAMSAAIDKLMMNPDERAILAARAPDVSERFSVEVVVSKWNSLLDNVCQFND